uniref:Uncharacterized protein n=1 Tax=Anguilla anguilla TaxID=7936 RepID=A0A0E9TMI7_ANGAN
MLMYGESTPISLLQRWEFCEFPRVLMNGATHFSKSSKRLAHIRK